jgi:hypothetical protein
MPNVRGRFWVETAAAAASFGLLLITLVSRDWVELVFRADPDHGSGVLEWSLVGASLTVTVIVSALARAEWRRPRAASASA